MLSQIYVWMMFISIVYVHTLPATSPDAQLEQQKYSDAAMINRLAWEHIFVDQPLEESTDEDDLQYEKRQVKKKWSKLHQGSQSPYTIAFPALIRSRRAMGEMI